MAKGARAGNYSIACRVTLTANLKYTAERLAKRKTILLLEAINARDRPSAIFTTQEESAAIS